MAFYKKQDYEPFGVPMGFSVLEDINAKYEMKKIDMAIARNMQQIILLVTTGAEPDKGGINPKNLEGLKALFENQSVGRVLIADYTTEAEFVVPAIAELLTPEKYEVLERDINIGLNNVFAGDEKFANQAQKVELFITRLEQARQAFLQNFLIPEMKRIAKSLGFKNFPTPVYEDFKLKDNTSNAKLYERLVEVGALTAEQGIEAINKNQLPDASTLLEGQKAYKEQRDNGLYAPLIGGKPAQGDAGSPGGVPSAPKTVTPIGSGKASLASDAEKKYSVIKITELMLKAQELQGSVEKFLKEKSKIKRLNKVQKEVADGITNTIVANEDVENWNSKVESYCNEPVDTNPKRINEINDLAAFHQISHYLASIMYASRID